MNFEQLRKNVGYLVKLVPPAHHLDDAGDLLPVEGEDWTIVEVTRDHVEIKTASGHSYYLGLDHIRKFTTDPHRSTDGQSRAFLTLHVQLRISGSEVTATPNHQPGAPVPPPANLVLKARATFVPELERVFRRQVQILDRAVVNYMVTANDSLGIRQTIRPGDTWNSLKPTTPRLFPDAAAFRDLSTADAACLAEFYGAVAEVSDMIEQLSETTPLTEYNAWNYLTHKVQHSLKLGTLAVQRLCPDRLFDGTMPIAGTLLSRSKKALDAADQARERFITKSELKRKEEQSKRRG
jgi:hypothetical protein